MSYNCPQPRNNNGGRSGAREGRGGSRSSYGGGRGTRGGGRSRGRGGSGSRANMAMSGEQATRWEKWQKSQTSETTASTFTQDPVTAAVAHFGNFANYARAGEGTHAHALASSYHPHVDWIIDSGASKHVPGALEAFASYTPYTHLETIQTTDGTSQPIKGVGLVGCTPHITLSSVLHVPSFPVNLLSISSIVDEFKCTVLFMTILVSFRRRGLRRGLGLESGVMGCGTSAMKMQLCQLVEELCRIFCCTIID